MTKLEHDAWLAVSGALDSIDGFAGGPKQAQAIGDAMSAICDLLDDEPNSKEILDSCPESPDYSLLNKFPSAGFPCEVWVYPDSKCLSYSAGLGKFREVVGEDPHYEWPHWRPTGLPEDARPGEAFVYYNNGEVLRFSRFISKPDLPDVRYIYTVPEEADHD